MEKRKMTLQRFLGEWGPVALIPTLFIIFSIIDPVSYLSANNVLNILRATCIYLVVGMGSTFAFSCGVFDLSVGSAVTLGGMFAISFQAWFGIPWLLAIVLTACAGALIGIINSLLVLKFNVNGMLATLSMQFILNGVALTYSAGQVVTATKANRPGQEIVGEVPDAFWNIGKAPTIIIFAFVCVLIVFVFQNFIKHGRYLYMVGENAEAARLSGIKVNAYRSFAFIMTGVFACLGGMVMAARNGSVGTTAGSSYLMPAIAAVNIGRSVAGINKPNALGTFVGVLLWVVLDNGLIMVGVPYYMVDIAKGVVLLLAMIVTSYKFGAKKIFGFGPDKKKKAAA